MTRMYQSCLLPLDPIFLSHLFANGIKLAAYSTPGPLVEILPIAVAYAPSYIAYSVLHVMGGNKKPFSTGLLQIPALCVLFASQNIPLSV